MEDDRQMEKVAALHDRYLLFPKQYFQVPADKREQFSTQLIAEAGSLISTEAPLANPDTISALVGAYDQAMLIFEAPDFDKPAFEGSLAKLNDLVQNPENLAAWQVTLVAGEYAYDKIMEETETQQG
jgi:hypothetical protein